MAFGLAQRRIWFLGAPLVLVLAAAAITTVVRPAPANAGPYVPSSDAEVLEVLPGQAAGAWLRTTAEVAPPAALDASTAVTRARAELVHYQESADPRYLGRAEAALGNFWDQPDPPEPVLVLRARIRQSNHEFLTALNDLDRAVALSPNDGQALLDRASIETVIGRYDAARGDCAGLDNLTAPLYVTVCRAGIAGVTGAAEAASAELTRALAVPRIEIEDKCWAESLLGELAARLGHADQAEAHFRRVLAARPTDTYVRGALADSLLDLGRDQEVVALLGGDIRQDALLLRLAIAERHAHASGFAEHLKDLGERFEEAHLRGNFVHRREEARFELALRDAPKVALDLALANFDVQREPADVRIALESALAANQSERVSAVVAFARASKLEDVHVHALLEKLGR